MVSYSANIGRFPPELENSLHYYCQNYELITFLEGKKYWIDNVGKLLPQLFWGNVATVATPIKIDRNNFPPLFDLWLNVNKYEHVRNEILDLV